MQLQNWKQYKFFLAYRSYYIEQICVLGVWKLLLRYNIIYYTSDNSNFDWQIFDKLYAFQTLKTIGILDPNKNIV